MNLAGWVDADLERLASRVRDGVLALVPAERRTERADGGGSTIAFLLWHVARHHDLAVNEVVRRTAQVLDRFPALASLGPSLGLAEAEPESLVGRLGPDDLVAYFDAVLTGTRAWLTEADLRDLDSVPDAAAGLDRSGVPDTEFGWLYRMWESQPAWYFLQWEAVGHSVNHLGEMVSIRNRMGLSPF